MSKKAGPPPKKILLKKKKTTTQVLPPQEPIIDDSLFEQYINSEYIGGSVSDLSELHQRFKNAKPFSHIRLTNFFKDEKFLQDLFSEMKKETYVEKSNDLYSFLQTKRDLRSVLVQEQTKNKKISNISKLCNVLYSKGFRNMIQTITGMDVELNQTIDLSGACYRDGAHLLCHDDELEGRRVAFILYFVDKDWSKEDGGSLDLFNVDENGQPDSIETTLVPEWNSFSFFEVTPYSFHQVAEVLQDKKLRVSISGWFHGPPIQRPAPYIEPALSYSELVDHKSNELLLKWVNDTYLNTKTQKRIRKTFENSCSVELQLFLKANMFNQLLQAVKQHERWNMIGPANRRHYEQMDVESAAVDPIIREFMDLFQSKQFAQCLSKVINVDVTNIHTQTRKFSPGCYTLVENLSMQETRLDAIFCLTGNNKKWKFEFGGHLVYMDEEEELLSVLPQQNSLSLVLRDKGTMQFVKYMNHNAPEPRLDFAFTYEVEFSDSDEEDE